MTFQKGFKNRGRHEASGHNQGKLTLYMSRANNYHCTHVGNRDRENKTTVV